MIRTEALALVTGMALLAGGCASPPQAEPVLVRGAHGARAIVIVLDASPGAAGLRPAAAATLDAALALAAADPEHPATGVLATGASGPIVLAPLSLEPTSDAAARAAALKGEAGLGRATRKALDALTTSEASTGSLVLLLSAEPGGEDARDVERVSAALARRSCRLIRIPLEAGTRPALEALARDAFGFTTATGSPRSVTLAAPGGTLAALFPANAPKVPANARTIDGPALRVALFAAATTGTIDLSGADEVLYRPSWTVGLEPDAPPPIAALGEAVPVSIVISGVLPDALAVTCLAVGAGPEAPVSLTRTVAPGSVRFEGQAPAPLEEGERELGIEVSFAAGEARFTLARNFRYLARRREGPAPPSVQVSPARLDLGVVWIDSRVPASLVLTGDPGRATRITLAPHASVEPASWVLAPGEQRTATFLVDPSKVKGGERLRLRASIEGGTESHVRPRARGEHERPPEPAGPAPERLVSVPLSGDARSTRLPATLELAVEAGSSRRIQVPLGLDARTRVTARTVLEPEDAFVSVTASLEGDALVLEASARSRAVTGKRTGRVELTLEGSNGPPLVRALAVIVTPCHELSLELDPPVLALKGRYGWTEGRVRLASNLAARLDVATSAFTGADGARITPRRDIRVGASDATWDAHGLLPGEGRDLLVRVYLPSDLPAGKYEGTVALALASSSGRIERPLPVTIEVER